MKTQAMKPRALPVRQHEAAALHDGRNGHGWDLDEFVWAVTVKTRSGV